MCLEDKIKSMFRKGDYSIVNVNEIGGMRSADIDMDGVSITAYPESKRAVAFLCVALTEAEAKELKRRILEKEYNKRKESLSEIEIEMQEIEKE